MILDAVSEDPLDYRIGVWSNPPASVRYHIGSRKE